jgi:hypothetical protein
MEEVWINRDKWKVFEQPGMRVLKVGNLGKIGVLEAVKAVDVVALVEAYADIKAVEVAVSKVDVVDVRLVVIDYDPRVLKIGGGRYPHILRDDDQILTTTVEIGSSFFNEGWRSI